MGSGELRVLCQVNDNGIMFIVTSNKIKMHRLTIYMYIGDICILCLSIII